MTSPFAQTQYQVRFDWGIEGAREVATDADIVIIVDVLGSTAGVDLALADGAGRVPNRPNGPNGPNETLSSNEPLSSHGSLHGTRIATALAAHPGLVVAGSLRNAAAVARWTLDRQDERGERFIIAIIAAGEQWDGGSPRFALEDYLGAGAIIEELAALGIDYCSPEAAAAGASFAGLRNATKHLITASGSGRELFERGEGDIVTLATQRNVSDIVTVL